MLTLNSGSSSLKFGLYRAQGGVVEGLLSGQALGLGGTADDLDAAAAAAVALIAPQVAAQVLSPQVLAHRIVHGGPQVRQHSRITPALLVNLAAGSAFAPLHTAAALALVRAAAAQWPGLPQVACLDTCFHADMPAVAHTLPLPQALRDKGLQRYGFHGLSCESVLRQLAGARPARLLIAHLGHGASVTAVLNGCSIDTSMGLTPAGGLVMGTRSGDLDPGLLLHLLRQEGLSVQALEDLVNRGSGLLGVSGLSSDMRQLHAAEGSHAGARLAIQLFCYAAAKTLGAMAVALGGVDQIVFTGGIGENDPMVRATICARLACLGVELDGLHNSRARGRISSDASRCVVQVLPSQEDEQIARHAWALCQAPAPS